MTVDYSSDQLPSDRRPIPLRKRPDLIRQKDDESGERGLVIKDPIAGSYWQLSREQAEVLELLDGDVSLREVRDHLTGVFRDASFSRSQIQDLILSLHEKGLVVSLRPVRNRTVHNNRSNTRNPFWTIMSSLLFWRLPGINPTRILDLLYPLTRWVFCRSTLALCLACGVVSWTLFLGDLERFHHSLRTGPGIFGLQSILLLWLAAGVTKVIHELAHGLTCRHFEVECTEMGLAFLLCSPCLYCDVSDAWLLGDKRKRILIAAAGPVAEIIMGTLCMLAWRHTEAGLFNQMLMNLFLVSTLSSVLLNLNPLLKYDGYYILADWLEIPNMRERSDRALADLTAGVLFGARQSLAKRQRIPHRSGLAVFALASIAYRWTIVFAICGFLYTMLKPLGLQAVAVLFGGAHVFASCAGAIRRLRNSIQQSEHRSLRPLRGLAVITVVIVGLGWGMSLPLPVHGTAACVLEPNAVQHVYAEVPGELALVLVRPGEHVDAGQPLMQLTSEEIVRDRMIRESEFAQQRVEVRLAELVRDHQARGLAEESLKLARQRTDRVLDTLLQLTLRAPVSGHVLSPQPVAAASNHLRRLPGWSGSPLEKRNRGAQVQRGTHLCSIAPDGRWQAVVFVHDDQKEFLKPAQQVELRIDAFPDRTIVGEVRRVAREGSRSIPATLSSRQGGPLVTTVGQDGREEATSTLYRVEVSLDEPNLAAVAGMRGTARFVIQRPTVLGWLSKQWDSLACSP